MRVGLKFDDFINHRAQLEALEGTTAAGKTTVGALKFMLEVAENQKKMHIIAGLDSGTVEKNIIQKEYGILDELGLLVRYNGNGTRDIKLPHLIFRPAPGEEKIIFVLGYADKTKWKKALGGQYGCVMIDEANVANMDFVRETIMRCDYAMLTLNPDDPSLEIYKEYINHCRPLKRWEESTPEEIRKELREEPKREWTHWFFSFDDNISLTAEKKQKIISSVPSGTKIYKNKIQGLRGRATGLVFPNFDRAKHVVTKKYAKKLVRDIEDKTQKEWFEYFSAGIDTSYSQKSADTIAMLFIGVTNKGRCFILNERVYSNAKLDTPIAPSDTVRNISDFLERNRNEWGFARNVFLDSADQATMMEWKKWKRKHGSIYILNDAWKSMEIIDRLNTQIGWFATGDMLIVEDCMESIKEIETYSWMEDKDNTPEDKNDHTVNAGQYGWIPYKKKIGVEQ